MPNSFLEDNEDFETKGYEYFYSEDSNDVEMTPEGDDTNNDKMGTTPSGQTIGDKWTTSLTGDNFIEIAFGNDYRIFGMPFNYPPLSDPLMRTYEETFESDCNVCFFTFGTPKINRALFMKLQVDSRTYQNTNKVDELFSVKGATLNIISNMTSGEDHRLISFTPNFKEYWKYASVTANYLYTMMDLPGIFDWDDFFDDYDSSGVPFFCTKQTSVSEGISNQYSESEIATQANQEAANARMNYQMYGTYGGVETEKAGTGAFLENIVTNLGTRIEEAIADTPVIGSIASVFMKTNRGSMQFYADLWQNSLTDNSYQLNFKFMTPYGNKLDVFRNVYFPWSLLFTASLPRQDGKYAFKEPFLVKVQFPGWFCIECGVIKSMIWNKGGDNQLWSAEGLPLEMNITLTVGDLYPNLMSSEKLTRLNYNRGLLSFLENMAGLNTTQISAMTCFDKIKNNFKLYSSKAANGGFGGILSIRNANNAGNDLASTTGSWLSGTGGQVSVLSGVTQIAKWIF